MLGVLVATDPLAADQRRLVFRSGRMFGREVGRKANLQAVFDVKRSRRFGPIVGGLGPSNRRRANVDCSDPACRGCILWPLVTGSLRLVLLLPKRSTSTLPK
ncbi:putative aminotransferase [Trichinella spiralis]|uniref:putative aminotransferase n=1 Tax=Trichinella spiralis TaxID=6334 RepID=UPI0001EFE023|nr:putative aminotransferase [Trichinella spiralis]